MRARRISFGREVRMESSAVEAKVRKSVILAIGRMIPPQLRRRSLSLTLVTVLRLKRLIYVLNYWYCNIHF